MRSVFPSTAVVVLALAAGVVGCDGDDTSVGGDASSDGSGGRSDSGGDSALDATSDSTLGVASMGSDAAVMQLTALRVANWSPGAPAADLCLSAHGATDFHGPLLAAVVASDRDAGTLDDAGTAGVAFPDVGAYFDLLPGVYDARIVVAGAPDCSVGIGADSTALPALGAGAFATFAVVGEAEPTAGASPLGVVAFSDEGPGTPLPDAATPPVAARFINAVAGEPVVTASIATAGTGTFTLVAPFGEIGRAGPIGPEGGQPHIDADGYASWNVTASATVSCSIPDPPVVLASGTLSTAGGGIVTIVLVGSGPASPAGDAAPDAGPTGAFQLIQCEDNAGTVGPLSSCALLPGPVQE